MRTADHGELLGAHGGLHQKWFNLYDEATRVPFIIARVGSSPTTPARIEDPTSHVDVVPTLLAAAGLDVPALTAELAEDFSEVHPLPGVDLLPVVDGAAPDPDRAVYLMTRDNMLEGDSGASGVARRLGRTAHPPAPLRIQVPAHVGANFEGLVCRVTDVDAPGGGGHRWKLVRTFDDPATWTEPEVRHLAAEGLGGPTYRTEPLPDQWELYDLEDDPIEAINRADDPAANEVFALLRTRLKQERAAAVPERHQPWPYLARRANPRVEPVTPPKPAQLLRRVVQRLGMHPEDPDATTFDLPGRRALVVATNHGVLDVGQPTGVFASEMTVPVLPVPGRRPRGRRGQPRRWGDPDRPDVAQADHPLPRGRSLPRRHPLAGQGHRFPAHRRRWTWPPTTSSSWPAAGARRSTSAPPRCWPTRSPRRPRPAPCSAASATARSVCCRAKGPDGRPLVEGRRVSGVTDKQVQELGIDRDAVPPRDRAAQGRRPLRVGHPLPRPVRQPLGRRRRPRHRPEPERRAHGGEGDAPPRRRTHHLTRSGRARLSSRTAEDAQNQSR